jgi:hypothetical protein
MEKGSGSMTCLNGALPTKIEQLTVQQAPTDHTALVHAVDLLREEIKAKKISVIVEPPVVHVAAPQVTVPVPSVTVSPAEVTAHLEAPQVTLNLEMTKWVMMSMTALMGVICIVLSLICWRLYSL